MASVLDAVAGSARFAHVCGRLGDRGRVGADGMPAVGGGADPYWSQVMLLVHGDGSPGEVAAPDSSQFARTPTITGGISVTDAGDHFGTGSLTNATTPSDVVFASSADFQIPMVFTLEFAITRAAETVNCYFMAAHATQYWTMNAAGALTSIGVGASLGTTLEVGVRTQIAMCRNADGRIRLFKDGVLDDVKTSAVTVLTNQAFGLFGVPGRTDLPSFFGRLEEVRYTKGVCRYDSDDAYTPPTGPFPNG